MRERNTLTRAKGMVNGFSGTEAILEMVMFPRRLQDKLLLMEDEKHRESVITAYLELMKDIIREAMSGTADPTGASGLFRGIVENGRNAVYCSGMVTLYIECSARGRSAARSKFEVVEFKIDAH